MAILFKSDKDPGVRQYNALKFCQVFVEEKHCQNIYPKIYDLIKEMPEPPYNKYVELSKDAGYFGLSGKWDISRSH